MHYKLKHFYHIFLKPYCRNAPQFWFDDFGLFDQNFTEFTGIQKQMMISENSITLSAFFRSSHQCTPVSFTGPGFIFLGYSPTIGVRVALVTDYIRFSFVCYAPCRSDFCFIITTAQDFVQGGGERAEARTRRSVTNRQLVRDMCNRHAIVSWST